MDEWIEFYDSNHSIYVSAKHRDLHFSTLADDVAAYVPSPDAVMIDYSCGEALSAARVAQACKMLILAEPAPGVRARLQQRFGGNPRIAVRSLDELNQIPAHSIDFIVMNSVAQYLTPDEFNATLRRFHGLLKPAGRFVLGDIVQPDVGPVTDAMALLRFSLRHGFFIAAVVGLMRTIFSDYRQVRGRLGLTRYSEAEIIARLRAAGFSAVRARQNIGHNPARMTFIAPPL